MTIRVHGHVFTFYLFVAAQADMLLDGSYVKDVETVLDALKVVRRDLIREGLVQVMKLFSFDN